MMQLRKITQRKNTVNGRIYATDPTIFAWELCNECHTNDNYEINLGQTPGVLLYNWQVRSFLLHLGIRMRPFFLLTYLFPLSFLLLLATSHKATWQLCVAVLSYCP